MSTDGKRSRNARGHHRHYAAGEVWSYRARPHEKRSRVRIVRVDPLDDGRTIYHVQVDGLSISNPDAQGGKQRVLSHAPVSRETLEASLLARLPDDRSPLVEFDEGYALWKREFDAGDAGFFLMPIDEIVQYVEDILTGVDEGG